VDPDNLGRVDDEELQAQYVAEIERVSDRHDPDDPI